MNNMRKICAAAAILGGVAFAAAPATADAVTADPAPSTSDNSGVVAPGNTDPTPGGTETTPGGTETTPTTPTTPESTPSDSDSGSSSMMGGIMDPLCQLTGSAMGAVGSSSIPLPLCPSE
ncbi:hypothetical protein [Nocardia nova]|uniref:hypothetical protein n=1 Tax=Nocardia nova TaxID=37330 RepID=UPI0033FE583F